MQDDSKKQLIQQYAKDFLKKHSSMVVATVSPSGEPQAATVYFVSNDDFCLYFMTSATSRKASNLRANSKIAFVIGWDQKEMITVQGEGQVTEVPQRDAQTFYDLITKNSFTSAYQWPILELAKEGYSVFKITPNWLTYLNMNTELYPEIATSEFQQII